ncbi:MAG TPA: HEPN domain-containing protein [Hanamia sp.]
MTTEEKNYLEQWLQKAEHDLLAARLIIDYQPIILDISCFHCQQAVEKYLKTFLIYHKKDFPKTHNIDLLLKICSTINDHFEEIDVKNLEDFAVRGRYPHDFLLPSPEEAEEFYQIAEEIKRLVLKVVTK